MSSLKTFYTNNSVEKLTAQSRAKCATKRIRYIVDWSQIIHSKVRLSLKKYVLNLALNF